MFTRTLTFRDAVSPSMEHLLKFHDFVIMIIIIIFIFVFYYIIMIRCRLFISLQDLSREILERVWTILPILILVVIAYPRLELLYYFEEIQVDPDITLKVFGNQWYWRYELIVNKKFLNFESYYSCDFQEKRIRLERVDTRVVLPVNCLVRVLVLSNDVIHSWSVARLGVKIDAVPGRVNQEFIRTSVVGVNRGYCSEICGVNHRQIPIEIEVIPLKNFIKWIKG